MNEEKKEIIRCAKYLQSLLEKCDDEEFVDKVCYAVMSNEYIEGEEDVD